MKVGTLAHAITILKAKDPQAYSFLEYKWQNAIGTFDMDGILAWAQVHKTEAKALCLSAIKLRVSKGYSY